MLSSVPYDPYVPQGSQLQTVAQLQSVCLPLPAPARRCSRALSALSPY